MAVLQIAADRPGSGKTSLAGALVLSLAAAGKKGVYYKPISPAGEEDPDATFFSDHSLTDAGSPVPPATCLLPPPAGTGSGGVATLQESLLEEVRSGLTQLSGQVDSVLLESPDLATSHGESSPFPLQLAESLDSRVVLLFKYTKNLSPDAISQACRPFGARLAGIIINGVTAYRTGQVNSEVAEQLLAQGLPFLGSVAEDRTMLGVSIAQIAHHLNGRWVQEPENSGARIERFLLGGNIMDAGPTHFGRYPNQAVVTGATRPDIQMASLSSGVRCLVLTGGQEPAEYARAEALQRGVPMILVDGNTMDTAEALGGLLDSATACDWDKIQRFLYLLQQNVDLETLASVATG